MGYFLPRSTRIQSLWSLLRLGRFGVAMDALRQNRLSRYEQDRLVRAFPPTESLALTLWSGVNRKETHLPFLQLCEIVPFRLETESATLAGEEMEVDESYFGQ